MFRWHNPKASDSCSIIFTNQILCFHAHPFCYENFISAQFAVTAESSNTKLFPLYTCGHFQFWNLLPFRRRIKEQRQIASRLSWRCIFKLINLTTLAVAKAILRWCVNEEGELVKWYAGNQSNRRTVHSVTLLATSTAWTVLILTCRG